MTIDQRTDKEKGLYHHELLEDGKGGGLESGKNFDQKLYYFPESYNALRRELVTNWPELWKLVGWPMAYAANMFVGRMNDALDLNVTLDSSKVDAICSEYYQALLKKRGSGLN